MPLPHIMKDIIEAVEQIVDVPVPHVKKDNVDVWEVHPKARAECVHFQ